MARLTDIFSNDGNDSSNHSNTGSDQNADGNANASNDGISLDNTSASHDSDGNSSYDHQGADTGGSDLCLSGDLGNMVDNVTHSMDSSDGTDIGQ